jgi:hypothetical protein
MRQAAQHVHASCCVALRALSLHAGGLPRHVTHHAPQHHSTSTPNSLPHTHTHASPPPKKNTRARSYGGSKLERARDLFESALRECPPEAAKPLFLEYAALEEAHGLGKHAMEVRRGLLGCRGVC